MFWLLQEVEGSADAVRDVVQAQPAPPQHLQDFLAKAAWYEGQKFSLTPQGSFMPAHVELAPSFLQVRGSAAVAELGPLYCRNPQHNFWRCEC
jgi:hypothetical protein